MATPAHPTPVQLARRRRLDALWRPAAPCRGLSPDLFYEHAADEAWHLVCDPCSVAEACLWSALVEELPLARSDIDGIRGGTTPTRRRRLARQLTIGEALDRLEAALAGPQAAAG